MEKTGHLPHVQGLRGIAVLAVVLYHAGVPIRGGYLGVDVFFVISGFVVTLSSIQQIEQSNFSLSNFYARRIRRLIPLLTVVNVATVLLSVFFLSLYGEIQKAFATVRWSTFFAANIQLLNENSYTQLIGNPFRHLWSLAVEEQFYFVFPIVTLLIIRFSKKSLIGDWKKWFGRIFILLFVISLVYYLLLTQNNQNENNLKQAFFSVGLRFWEFSIGVLMGIYLPKLSAISKKITFPLQSIAICALGVSLVFLSTNHLLPRAVLVVPVFSTAVILIVGQTGALGSILSSRILTFLGDVSYGWYLWHWPLIVFVDLVFPRNVFAAVTISIFALLLSSITYQRIENPFRRNSKIQGVKAVGVLLGATLAVNLSVISAHAIGRLARENLLPTNQIWGDGKNNVLEECFLGEQYETWIFNDAEEISNLCSWPKKTIDSHPILAIGDSHMASYSGGLMTAAAAIGSEITLHGAAGCPPVFASPKGSIRFCNRMSAAYINAIIAFRPSVVILSGRTSLYTSKAKGFEDENFQVPYVDGTYPSDKSDYLDSYLGQLDRTISFATKYGAKVIVALEPQIAQLNSQSIIQHVFPGWIGGSDSESVDRIRTRESIRTAIYQRFSTNPKVLIFDPEFVLCTNRNQCLASRDEEPMYSDDNHLSMFGSLLFTEKWRQILEKALVQPD
jgi:peptidoglycan/LPS O-acetylase OafA/YrhL